MEYEFGAGATTGVELWAKAVEPTIKAPARAWQIMDNLLNLIVVFHHSFPAAIRELFDRIGAKTY